ncbi:MAG TPA: ABC transporter permease [Vicinamibacterales bacterium]|jgi:predicted permease
MNLRDLKLRARALFAPRRAERDLDEELTFHIERDAQKHIANGVGPDEAWRRARARFGSVTVAADNCRDERGVAVVDNLARDVVYAFRTFRRAPLAALTIVTTVALGLGLVTVVFTFLNIFMFRVDNVPNLRELFGVERPRTADGDPVPFTRPQYEALVRETSVFSGAFAMMEVDTRVDGRNLSAMLVTGNFFHVLGVNASVGRTLTVSDDERSGGNPVVVLSHRGWSQRFGRDPNILSRTVLLNGAPFQIVGVMPEGFRGLMVGAPDFWVPMSFAGQLRPAYKGREDSLGLDIIGRLRPGLSREQALAELIVWDSRSVERRAGERPAANLLLEPRLGTVPQPAEAIALVSPLFFAFGLILMIGCANVANLLLARSVARQREIGIRLATGASRPRIVCQLLTESLLLALASAVLAFGISRLVLELTINTLTSTMPPDIGDIRLAVPRADWRVALFLVAGAVVSTMFFALMPALQATRVELVRAIRGEVVRDARPGRTRNVLIALQVTASALLLICSAVFLRSALAISTIDPGIRTADTVALGVNEHMRTAVLEALRRDSSVASIAASWPGSLIGGRGALAEGASVRSTITYKFVSPEYFDVLGIDILRGRGFSPAERSSGAAVTVVAESVARELWPGRDALGQVLQLAPDASSETRQAGEPSLVSRTFVVVGIARDVAGFKFPKFEGAGVYIPISAEAPETSFTLRMRGDPEIARRALVDRLTAIDPSLGEVLTLRLLARMATYLLQIGFWLSLALGALALILTLSGLFSVLSYLVEQRANEIGVRMALGATRRNVCVFVLRQLTWPVGFGLIVGATLAAALSGALLAIPGSEQIGTIVRLFDPIAYTASLLCIVTACACAALIPAMRAGRIDPVVTLRRD